MEVQKQIKKILGDFDANKVAGILNKRQPDLVFHAEILKKSEEIQELLAYPEWQVMKTLMGKIQKEALHKFRFEPDHPLEENGVVIAFERLQNMINDLLAKGEMSKEILKGKQ